VQVGNWIREHRGIYRLALFPMADRPDLVLWALWSRNRAEETEGVYSHQTALSLYELSDLNPSKVHMTVPRTSGATAIFPVFSYSTMPICLRATCKRLRASSSLGPFGRFSTCSRPARWNAPSFDKLCGSLSSEV
jgi:hypothetical protein